MSEMAPERPPLCAVCSTPLPVEIRRGRPRKVCRDEDSPTPGGCARTRRHEQRSQQRGVRSRIEFTPNDRDTIRRVFYDVGHGFSIE